MIVSTDIHRRMTGATPQADIMVCGECNVHVVKLDSAANPKTCILRTHIHRLLHWKGQTTKNYPLGMDDECTYATGQSVS